MRLFPAGMDGVLPWTAQVGVIKPDNPNAKTGRSRLVINAVPGIFRLGLWFDLALEAGPHHMPSSIDLACFSEG